MAGVRKTYGAAVALDSLDLEIEGAEIFGLLGPNGAGKTTAIRILTGLAAAEAGELEVLGMRSPERLLEIKRRLGVVPEEGALFDRLTGREQLVLGGRLYGVDRRTAQSRADELLELFQLTAAGETLIAGYSKGMRKRLALAAALIHRPDLLLLDEPFEAVDPSGARVMKRILLEQAERGATVLLTSHVLETVEKLCTRVGVLVRGRLAAAGAPGDLAGEGTLEELFIRLSGQEPAATPAWLR